MLNRLFYIALFASLMALLTMPARGAEPVPDPPPLVVGGMKITYAASFHRAWTADPPRLAEGEVTRAIRAADAAVNPPVVGIKVLPDEVRKCPAGKCQGEGCRCADESKCGTPQGTCQAPLLPPLPVQVPSPAYDADHTCNRCGAYQNVVSRFLPGGAHTHRCNRCGHEWQHGGPVVYGVTRVPAQASPVVAWPAVGGCSSGNCGNVRYYRR